MIIARWAECLQNLLNWAHDNAPAFLDDLPTLLIIPNPDEPPSFDKVVKAIHIDNKATGPDSIPPEVIMYGGRALHRWLLNFILNSWSAKCLPQQCKNPNIILVYKLKADWALLTGNSHGISIVCIACKVLGKIVLTVSWKML